MSTNCGFQPEGEQCPFCHESIYRINVLPDGISHSCVFQCGTEFEECGVVKTTRMRAMCFKGVADLVELKKFQEEMRSIGYLA